MELLKITDAGELFVKCSPGGRWYYRKGDDRYYYRSFVLGVCGSGSDNAYEFVSRLWKLRKEDPVSFLKKLGWPDAVAKYKQYEEEMSGRELLRLQANILSLEKRVNEIGNKDYATVKRELYEQLERSPGFDPEDVSQRRLHQHALCLTGGIQRSLVESRRKLAQRMSCN
ncbi:MAG: hypothetical protein RLZZ303_493 [Candidatus Hydrogenedentota bacterium]|jgi:hypothetical protein